MLYEPEAVRRVNARMKAQLRKAGEKYGPEALGLMGDLNRDVFDYAINELAGMPRYCEMMQARLDGVLADDTETHRRVARVIQRTLDECLHLAILLETVRTELLHMKLIAGEREKC